MVTVSAAFVVHMDPFWVRRDEERSQNITAASDFVLKHTAATVSKSRLDFLYFFHFKLFFFLS